MYEIWKQDFTVLYAEVEKCEWAFPEETYSDINYIIRTIPVQDTVVRLRKLTEMYKK